MQGAMLDTNVFNEMIDGRIPKYTFSDYRLVATHIQIDELNNTPDATRRARLIELTFEVVREFEPTSSAVWDVSRWDQAKWGDNERYQRMLSRLIQLDKKSGKRIRQPNQQRDILIAETAIFNDFLFISRDATLVASVLEEGGMARTTTPPSPPSP